MQLSTFTTLLCFAASGAAQITTVTAVPCRNGQYSCGTYNGQGAIYVCNGGVRHLSAICGASRCQVINGLPYCV